MSGKAEIRFHNGELLVSGERLSAQDFLSEGVRLSRSGAVQNAEGAFGYGGQAE